MAKSQLSLNTKGYVFLTVMLTCKVHLLARPAIANNTMKYLFKDVAAILFKVNYIVHILIFVSVIL
ncbi:hypothetical protein EDC01DRAFT_643088 [Geopyxis carbonaria]|nr:hypothetical protein EDC01DRAFT_643088 [Geopyxis carbonaria]